MGTPEPPDRELTAEEFAEAMKDPEFYAAQVEQWHAILRGDYGDVPAELRASVESAVRKADEYAAAALVAGKMHALQHVINRPAGSMPAEDRLAQCPQLAEDLTDAILAMPEPHRTPMMTAFIPMRDAVRALKIE